MFDEDGGIGDTIGAILYWIFIGWVILLFNAVIHLFKAWVGVGKYVKNVFGRRGLIIYYVISFLVFIILAIKGSEGIKGSETSPPEVKEWQGGAKNIKEVGERIITRLEEALNEMGIDSSNVVANAKANPAKLIRPVPEPKKMMPRYRLLVLSNEDEAKIAQSYVKDCLDKKLFVDNDSEGLERVNKIVSRLVPVIPQIKDNPKVYLLRDDSVNACCLPDGTIFVNTGTLSMIKNDDLLAAILAHELGHAAAQHGNEGFSRVLKILAVGVVVEESMIKFVRELDNNEGVFIVRYIYGLGASAAYDKPRDRRAEYEADRLGTRYLARAGYNPKAMLQLFEWFASINPEGDRSFEDLFRTHPYHIERADNVRKVLQEDDLYEMPKNLLDEIATNYTNAVSVSTNLIGKVKNIPNPNISTNILERLPKLPFGKGKAKEGESK